MTSDMSSELKISGTSGQDVYVGRPDNRRRYAVFAMIAIAGIVGAWFLYRYIHGYVSADTFFERSKVRTAVVTRGNFERTISVEGNVVATFSPTLFAQDTGQVHLVVEAGDKVTKGQLLAEIDNPELSSHLKREQASLKLLQVQLNTKKNEIRQEELNDIQSLTLLKIKEAAAERELARMSKIVNAGSISVNDYEKIKDNVHALSVQVKNTEQQNKLKKANNSLELRTKLLSIDQQKLLVDDLQRQVDALQVASPVNGVVGDIQVKEQDTVARKQPIMSVVDLSSYELEVQIPETYADSLHKGLPVRVSYANKIHKAYLSSISPQVHQGTVSARVVFDGPAPKGLRENLRLDNQIILESKKNVLMVKRGPFVESHGGHGVYVMDNRDPDASMARFRRIDVGSVGVNEVEIKDGLKPGEVVIISNTAELSGADKVLITD